MDAATLGALAEPNRLRIVKLLATAPRPVGEIAVELELRQPQVTKHLQILERASLVRAHPLGQRRIYSLCREPLAAVRDWLAGLVQDDASEHALIRYERALAAETRRLALDRRPRTVRVRRTIAARPAAVWAAWTQPAQARRWWSPQHFSVAKCTLDPIPGGELDIVLAEGDGRRHRARGRFTRLQPPHRLAFELAPQDAHGRPLFQAAYAVQLEPTEDRTVVKLRIHIANPTDEAAAALAGIQLGWQQSLDKLATLLA